jgi:NAD(P)-dependent dehydrogenase (short-subunit alcohol dehydrogenase family)
LNISLYSFGKAAADAAAKKVLFIECDISNAESVKNLVAKTLGAFGTIDILINNAGILLYQKPISETSD